MNPLAMRLQTERNTRDFAQYSRCADLKGLDVMRARWVEHSFASHMHDFYAVSLNYRGHGTFDCRRQAHSAAPGTCNLIAPGEVHTGRATSADGWSYCNLYIDPQLMTSLLRSAGWKGAADVRFKSSLVKDTVLAARLAATFASMAEPSSLLQKESLLLLVMGRLITDHIVSGHPLADFGAQHVAVRRARECLDAYPEQNVSIGSLADLAGLSPYHFVRAFQKHMGTTPHRYQAIVRVNRARQLLRSGVPLADVAMCTGFYDQSHLTRWFKKILGTTPGQYAVSSDCG